MNGTQTRESRVPLPDEYSMTAEQRAIYDAVVTGRRGRMIGPLRAVIHSSQLATHWSKLGEYLRYDMVLPPRLTELAILAVGRRWGSEVEWWVHSREAEQAGLDPAIVSAILRSSPPSFADDAEREVYEFARELQQEARISDATYTAIRLRWGDRGVVELTALIGYYTMVSMTLNAHLIPLPDGEVSPLAAEKGLVDLPAAAS